MMVAIIAEEWNHVTHAHTPKIRELDSMYPGVCVGVFLCVRESYVCVCPIFVCVWVLYECASSACVFIICMCVFLVCSEKSSVCEFPTRVCGRPPTLSQVSRHIYEWVLSHIRMRRVTNMNASHNTFASIMAHIQMSLTTWVNVSTNHANELQCKGLPGWQHQTHTSACHTCDMSAHHTRECRMSQTQSRKNTSGT